jgi:hypothetical protein
VRHVALTAVLALALALEACGIQVKGKAGPEDAGGTIPIADASPSTETGTGDGGASDASCSVVLDEPFAVLNPNEWLTTRDSDNDDYPKVVAVGPENLLAMLKQNELDARGGVWARGRVPFAGFDMTFMLQTSCALCGDGFTVAWLGAATEDELDDAVDNRGLGVPKKLAGGAVALDLYTNSETADAPTPNMSILDIDGLGTPGEYDWNVTSSPQRLDLLNQRHEIKLTMREKQVVVAIDGVTVIQGVMSNLPAEGTFGFTASTGGRSAGIFVKDLKATFYRCDVPP